MKLDKTAYFFEQELTDTGEEDRFGRPIYEYGEMKFIPFQMEYEPYSPDLAKNDYGINVVNVTFLMYTYPDKRMELDAEFIYESTKYRITYIMAYDKHYEVFIKDIGKYPEDEY